MSNLPEKKTRKNNLLPSTLDCPQSREPQPEKGTILLICFEAMFERMSLFSCPDRKISSEEKGISSEEIAINVQLYPISSEDIALIVQERGISSEKTRINVHSCTD